MITFRIKLAILCAKAANYIIQKILRRKGGVFPGYLARLIAPEILLILSAQVREKIIVTMGTNGKTTTNSILHHVLSSSGKKVIINKTGANMLNGIVCAFVLAADRRGRLSADYACIEVDEFASMQVLPQLKPGCILLTNIFRDQIDRYGEIDAICGKIQNSLSNLPRTKLIVNCDDFLSYTLALQCPCPVVTYGINQRIFDQAASPEVRESTFCRICGEKLEYAFFHYGQLGIYRCPHCSFKRPQPDYTAKNIILHSTGYSFDIENTSVSSHALAPYNIYNILSAFAVLHSLNLSPGIFREAVSTFDFGNHREEIFSVNGARIHLFLAKNPIGFQQKISQILQDTRPKDLLILINDSVQDGRDISWLWDVNFRYLKIANASSIIVSGSRRLDVSLRMKYEDIDCTISGNLKHSVQKLSREGTGNLYIIVNYSGLLPANRMLHRMQRSAQKGDFS